MQKFNRKHAKAILKPCLRADEDFTTDERDDGPTAENDEPVERCKNFKIDKRGVWPVAEFDKTDKEGSDFGQWRPVLVFADADVDDTPMLPFPFTAGELAAFMVDGVGALVGSHYGDWADGPDPDRLNDIPRHENFARLAVKGAFDAYREAEQIAGIKPLALFEKAECARKARNKARSEANIREDVSGAKPGTEESRLRIERAKASIAALDAEMESTAKDYQDAYDKWLNKMVRELLKPAPAQTTAMPAPLEQVPVVDLHLGGKVPPVEPASNGPAPLTTTIHSTKARRDTLTPVIELAQSRCRNN